LELQVDPDAMTVEPVLDFRVGFSPSRGSVTRHENGNTLVCTGLSSNFYELDPQGNVLWEADFSLKNIIAAGRYYPAMWDYSAK